MGAKNLIFLEVLEWLDDAGYRAQLIVRESQAAVFFYNGKALGAFGPGAIP